jgi:Fic family protein
VGHQPLGAAFALQGRRVDAILIKLVQRIREEFQEAPGLRLTSDQAARFWGLDLQTCEAVLIELRRAGFLVQRSDGRYQQF